MSYIGENVAVADFSKQTFTANSSTTVFTLSSSVANSSCLIVSVGGVIQEPDVAYTASGTTLTFSVAPTTGNDVYVIYIGKELPVATHSDNTITNALIPDGIITSDKIQSLVPSKLTGALPAIDGSALTGVSVNTDFLEDNIALLGFKLAANNSLAKFNLVDRTIDEYQDATGIDVSSSTDETAGGTGTGKYYSGSTAATAAGTYSGTWTSAAFQGLYFNADASYDLGTSDFTLEWFQKTTSAQVSTCGIIGQTNEQAWTSTAYHVGYYNNNIVWGSGGSAIANTFTFGSSSHNNAWHHMALVRDSGTLRAYRDGVASGTTASHTIAIGITGSRLAVGAQHGGGSSSYNGLLDGVRVSTVCRYPSGTTFTPSQSYASDANTSLYLDFERADFSGVRGVNSAYAYISSSTGPASGTQGPEGGNDARAPITRTADNGQGEISSTTAADMDLVSTSTTASTAPTKGDITLLIEDVTGTATLNTDIKAYVSRDGGSGWDQGTLVHEGTWGTNKKVLSFHDQTFSNSASGTDMRYKITTHNQSVSKETRIHATSLAWA